MQNESWVERAKSRSIKSKKQQRLTGIKSKIQYNYGVLHDFFNYSAVSIQASVEQQDLTQVLTTSSYHKMASLKEGEGLGNTKQLSNVFAIAKVGVPNLILPSSLNLNISNYQNFTSYTALSDKFFPGLSHSQHTVVLMRPVIVKNGLSDLFLQIFKANDFVLLKRKFRLLTNSEVNYLAKVENISKANAQLYYSLMMDGECEILVMSKLGAVKDAQSIMNGSNPFGRRRIPQVMEDQSNIRQNVDSVNALYEINPFSSLNELFDLEDFMLAHSHLEKYRKQSLNKQSSKMGQTDRLADQLYFQKVQEIHKEINLFSRFFNICGISSSTPKDAHKQMCILIPETAIIEEVVVILNPIYNKFMESAEDLIKRMGFAIIEHKFLHCKPSDAENILNEKYEHKDKRIIQLISDSKIHMWQLAKIGGDREIRQTFKDSQIDYEDFFALRVRKPPFKPLQFPYLFIFMETPKMMEKALSMLWLPKLINFTGKDMIGGDLSNKEKLVIMNVALQVTVGDTVKSIYIDREGNITKNGSGADEEVAATLHYDKEPQIQLLMSNPKDSCAVHYVVESEGHGIYEMRFQRLAHKDDLQILNIVDPSSLSIDSEKMYYFTKFQSLNYYYNEVNKLYYNVCPSFYRFKIAPLTLDKMPSANPASSMPSQKGSQRPSSQSQASQKQAESVKSSASLLEEKKDSFLNRVYEVEEYMGKVFIEEIANMHQAHLKMQDHNKKVFNLHIGEEQKSLPAYVWGFRFAKMCEQLQEIKPNVNNKIAGGGRIIFKDGGLRGEVQNAKDYYEFEKKRYTHYLNSFRKGWHYYLSVLETDIIEQKLTHILNSLTFKYSRMPQFLSLIPDQVHEINLRISERLKVLGEDWKVGKNKFFTTLKENTINPNREEATHSQVQSLMYTLKLEMLKEQVEKQEKARREREGVSEEEVMNKKEETYSIHNDCGIVGAEIALRNKYQLVASILYLINFHLRKVERRTELFSPSDSYSNQLTKEQEDSYDEVLDIVFNSMIDNFGDNTYNYALDMAKIQKGYETEFEIKMKEQIALEQRVKENMKLRVEEEKRKRRTTMKEQELIDSLCYKPQREYELQQAELLKRFVERRGHQDQNGDEFQQILQQSQSMLGSYSLKLAQDFVDKLIQAKKGEGNQRQEKISFVKMEYFLYGITQAFIMIQDLKRLEERIGQLNDRCAILAQEVEIYERQAKQTIAGSSFHTKGQSSELNLLTRKQEEFDLMKRQMERMRYTISMKETELLLTFRELMSWNYFVDDHYFDQQKLLEQQKKNEEMEQFVIPLKTFWRAVYHEDQFENDLRNKKFFITVRDFQKDPPEAFLPAELCRQPFSRMEQNWQKRSGTVLSNLRPHDHEEPNPKMVFNKLYSQGELNEFKSHNSLIATIKEKTTKIKYQPDIRF